MSKVKRIVDNSKTRRTLAGQRKRVEILRQSIERFDRRKLKK